MIDKKKIVALILLQLQNDLAALKAATLATYDAATNEESKPENQYDTRALEASYLAGAQAKRLAEIEDLLFLYQGVALRSFGQEDTVDLTALVQLGNGSRQQWVFLMAKGGGLKVQLDGTFVQTVTPESPLGEALMGLSLGDVAVVEDKTNSRTFTILLIL
jgi:hypothetical protein